MCYRASHDSQSGTRWSGKNSFTNRVSAGRRVIRIGNPVYPLELSIVCEIFEALFYEWKVVSPYSFFRCSNCTNKKRKFLKHLKFILFVESGVSRRNEQIGWFLLLLYKESINSRNRRFNTRTGTWPERLHQTRHERSMTWRKTLIK